MEREPSAGFLKMLERLMRVLKAQLRGTYIRVTEVSLAVMEQ